MRRVGFWRRSISVLVGVSLTSLAIVSVDGVVGASPPRDVPDWLEDLEPSSPGDEPILPPLPEPQNPAPGEDESEATAPLEAALPEPGADVVTLGEANEAASLTSAREVSLVPATDAVAGSRVQVEVLDQEAAQRLGVQGFVFTLKGTPSAGSLADLGGAAGLPAALEVDYSAFEYAFGAGYGDRLRVVALPECVLLDPIPVDCETTGAPLLADRDTANRKLRIDVTDLGTLASEAEIPAAVSDERPAPGLPESVWVEPSRPVVPADVDLSPEETADLGFDPSAYGGIAVNTSAASNTSASDGVSSSEHPEETSSVDGSIVLAVTSAASGDPGDFVATPLSLTSTWSVAPGSGEFSWSYPIPIPAPPAGRAPSVNVSYSSGAVDGMVSTRNAQAGPLGVGFGDFASGFIERRYVPCFEDGGQLNQDLCWSQENLMISVDGISSELVPIPGSGNAEWRMKNDLGWRVVRQGAIPNEWWIATAPDGTAYTFGVDAVSVRGRDGVQRDHATGARWTVPVWGDDPGEPCRTPSDTLGLCAQAGWRFNLTMVTQPSGVHARYFYDEQINHYAAINFGGDLSTPYTMGGYLNRIEYGALEASAPGTSEIVFETAYRCVNLTRGCAPPTWASGTMYPDTPADLLCNDGENCQQKLPSFFSTKYYDKVRTQVFADGGWRSVDEVNLTTSFITNADGDKKLYLSLVRRYGYTSGQVLAMPPVTFTYRELVNWVDGGADGAPTKTLGHGRLEVIKDEYGHETRVAYGRPRPCLGMERLDWPSRDCFFLRNGDTWHGFNKWLTARVDEVDGTGGSPTMTTTYSYEGTAGWVYERDPLVKEEDRTWRDWRGYGSVLVTQGPSHTRLQVFRGLHYDRCGYWCNPGPPAGRRNVSITSQDGSRTVADQSWLAGTVFDEAQLNSSGNRITHTLHDYESRPTAQPTLDRLDWAVWSGETATTESAIKTDGTYARRRINTTYNARFQPEALLEEGWTDDLNDQRCTKTTYATNEAAWMFSYPATTQLLAGDCSSTSELRYSEILYDGTTTVGSAPTKGFVTAERTKIDGTTFSVVSTTHDSVGRPLTVHDPLNRVTTTAYEPAPRGEYPNWVSVTNAFNHTVTTEVLPDRGVPLKVTDANGRLTTYAYDPLGRFSKGWSPSEQGGTPTVQVSYQIALGRDAPPVVQTRRLTGRKSDGTDRFEDSWVLYDSLGRERRAEVLSPAWTEATPKIIVTGTAYDERGLLVSQAGPQAVAASGGHWVDPVWDNKINTAYDEVGRQVRQATVRREGNSDVETAVTTTAYTHNTATVNPPVGGSTRSIVDGLGRTVEVAEHDGTSWRTSMQLYNLADDLAAVVDPAGNVTGYTYDKAGRRIGSDDPDAGAWSYGYDLAGNETRVTDAYNASVFTDYDALNRPTVRYVTSPNSPLATWAYDAQGELGLPDFSTRVTAGGTWKIDVTAYDARNRPTGTRWTVPTSVTGLGGNYEVSYGYDQADRQTSITYPAFGGLSSETVTTRYNGFGQPEYMAGTSEYVWAAAYDDRARPLLFGYGPRPGGNSWMGRIWAYDADQRLASVNTNAGGVTSEYTYKYDKIGQITERTTRIGADDRRECFGYDQRNRLVTARTVALNGTCVASTPDGGDQPYKHSYAYGIDGNMRSRTEGSATSTYAYPAAGQDRAHAPTNVVTGGTTDLYTWGNNGELTQRRVSGSTETLTWDPERRLASITGPAGTDGFVYEPSGERLLREGPNGRTIYVAGQEISARLDGTNVKAVRLYHFGGQLVATRSPSGVDYVVANEQGSVEATFASGGTMEVSRTYAPYGERRTGGEYDSDQGWIGEIEDDSRKLAYLNARYYDPNISTFISPDPLMDLNRIKSINSYAYAHGNPINNEDKTGLCIPVGDSHRGGCYHHAKTTAGKPAPGGKIHGTVHPRPSICWCDPGWGDWLREQEEAASTLRQMLNDNPDPNFWIALAMFGPDHLTMIAAMSAPGYSFVPHPGSKDSDCGRDWISVDCIQQLAQHVDVNVAVPAAAVGAGGLILPVGCVGGGFQGGTYYQMSQAGVCSPGISIGISGKEYEDRHCESIAAGIPVTGRLPVNVYGSVGYEDGSLDASDWEAGLSLGSPNPSLVYQRVYDGEICE